MDDLVDQIRRRIESGKLRVSDHAQGRLDERGLLLSDILARIPSWSIIETYVTGRMGPSFLGRHLLTTGPIHAIWGTIDADAVMPFSWRSICLTRRSGMRTSQPDARGEQVTRLVEENGYVARFLPRWSTRPTTRPIGAHTFHPATHSSSTRCAGHCAAVTSSARRSMAKCSS